MLLHKYRVAVIEAGVGACPPQCFYLGVDSSTKFAGVDGGLLLRKLGGNDDSHESVRLVDGIPYFELEHLFLH